MSNASEARAAARPDYGLDAPGVVRNLFLAAAAGLLLWGTAAFGLWSGALTLGPVRLVVAPMGLWAGLGCLGMAIWMVWTSRFGKLRERERLLDRISWNGAESVLDVGCGRGLMLVGAAKRLTTGRATGVDIWQSEDLSGNRPEAPLENARREGVSGRVAVETADMRKLPFPDASFDVVVSVMCFHEVRAPKGAAMRGPLLALGEALRVLRPGGRFVLVDRFADAADYGDPAEVAPVLQAATELRRESLVARLSVPWPLNTKRALGPVEVLSGRKCGQAP